MEIIIFSPFARLIDKLQVNSDDKIQYILSHINKKFNKIPNEQYLILRDMKLDPNQTLEYYNICNSTALFYTENKNMIKQGFLNSSVFFRDFYYGGNASFASRQKFAQIPPTNCEFCSNPVYTTVIGDGLPYYGEVCYEHVPHIPLNFYHMGIGYVYNITQQNFRFNSDTNKWICYKKK